ncbi:energy transducer TonB [Hymenobacter sp. BRD67]|uniref:energy transducer TonB n=1 Tax=Hymenobacter sp. BRD67 TaxID=2675877 RepID=UPI0015630853|nr:energy transducer TonB [Hymenobacter sp. BRD67]QKG54459.1 energy transducer TonB [Hymenobacter sp. BRD67]
MALLGNDPTAIAYTGPRFPGGPDSLQALLTRVQRQAGPALTGEVFLRLELDNQGNTQKSYFLMPPAGSPAFALISMPAVQALAGQLVQQLPTWQLVTGAPGQNKSAPITVTLPLLFGQATLPTALNYSDENPTFPGQKVQRRLIPNLGYYVQTQVRYPVDDLRHGRQGVVYAYFEVSETGALEQRRIVGSVSPTLDAEVLRVLNSLPNALTPPRQQGRPVRVGYVQPFTFRIQ